MPANCDPQTETINAGEWVDIIQAELRVFTYLGTH